MTDAYFKLKISLARSKDIKVIADANIPVKLKLSELDLCCVLEICSIMPLKPASHCPLRKKG